MIYYSLRNPNGIEVERRDKLLQAEERARQLSQATLSIRVIKITEQQLGTYHGVTD